jgi:HSP20 family protein
MRNSRPASQKDLLEMGSGGPNLASMGNATPPHIQGENTMTSLTRYTPFSDPFDDFFKGFLVRPVSVDTPASPAHFRMDVTEEDGAYVVHAEVPGVKKEDINVTIDGNQVAITAEVKTRSQGKGEKSLRSERYYGKVYRAFSLAQDVDEGAAQAKYSDGVLELRLPKKAAESAKKLTIQ